MVRHFIYATFCYHFYTALTNSKDDNLAGFAAKSLKEVTYHLRHSSQWLVRLGDGTEESHARVQQSLDELWRFTGEMFDEDELDVAMREHYNGPGLLLIEAEWRESVRGVIEEATLSLPEDGWMASGGKQGRHSEHMGYLLAEMQHLQRTYPGASW